MNHLDEGFSSSCDDCIDRHRTGTAIYNGHHVLARGQPGYVRDSLLRLARTRRGQVGCGAGLSVDLNLDFACARFLLDGRNGGAGADPALHTIDFLLAEA